MTQNRDSFVFYRSFYEVIKLLDDFNAKALLSAIGDYALDGVEPTFNDNILKAIWLPIRPQLEANRRRYENGKRGGTPKGSRNNPSGKSKHQDVNIESSCQPEADVMEAVFNPQIKVPVVESSAVSQSIPTLIDVRLYVQNERLNVDPEKFYAYYQKHEWMSGPNPLYNWQAMVRKWHQNAEIKASETNSPLGVGERYDEAGNRTYGESGIIVPCDAPRRPSDGHWWNPTTNLWEKCV